MPPEVGVEPRSLVGELTISHCTKFQTQLLEKNKPGALLNKINLKTNMRGQVYIGQLMREHRKEAAERWEMEQ